MPTELTQLPTREILKIKLHSFTLLRIMIELLEMLQGIKGEERARITMCCSKEIEELECLKPFTGMIDCKFQIIDYALNLLIKGGFVQVRLHEDGSTRMYRAIDDDQTPDLSGNAHNTWFYYTESQKDSERASTYYLEMKEIEAATDDQGLLNPAKARRYSDLEQLHSEYSDSSDYMYQNAVGMACNACTDLRITYDDLQNCIQHEGDC